MSASGEDPDDKDEIDPTYQIAYDIDQRKVGCILIQSALGGDVPRALFHNYFGDTTSWTVNASGCKIYQIRQSQLSALAARTSFDRSKEESPHDK